MDNEELIAPEGITTAKESLRFLTDRQMDRFNRICGGFSVDIGKDGKEFSKELSLKEKCIAAKGCLEVLENLHVASQPLVPNYLAMTNDIRERLSSYKTERMRVNGEASKSDIEIYLIDYAPDRAWGIVMDWHRLVMHLLQVAGHLDAKRKVIDFANKKGKPEPASSDAWAVSRKAIGTGKTKSHREGSVVFNPDGSSVQYLGETTAHNSEALPTQDSNLVFVVCDTCHFSGQSYKDDLAIHSGCPSCRRGTMAIKNS